MCGFAGYLSFDRDYNIQLNEKFHSCLKFRGPDNYGFTKVNTEFVVGELFHYRLSIIDLDTRSNQPFVSGSGKTIIVFNGEIYNYKLLKLELELQGYQFKTNSDTEVIVTAYESFGIDKMIKKLDGMFSFVILDKLSGEIHLCRDPFGKKPLYYSINSEKNRVIFSSDIRSFENFPMELTIDYDSLSYYFCELSTPEKKSIYREVQKVKQGTYLTVSGRHQVETNYFKLDFSHKINASRTEIINESERLLNLAVQKRMIADVDVSAFLSGGIDSSLIVALMAQNSSKKIKTYTVGYKDKNYNESEFASKVAAKYNTQHQTIFLDEMNPKDIKEIFEECGEPFADSSLIPSSIICKAISKNEKVALSGDGGDEIFAGYYEYYFTSRVDKYKKSKFFIQFLNQLYKLGIKNSKTVFANELIQFGFNLPEYFLLHRKNMGFNPNLAGEITNVKTDFSHTELKEIWSNSKGNNSSLLKTLMASSFHTRLVNDYLVKIDRASMMNSLEVRSPFLDKDLAQFAASIPEEQLLYQGVPKSITKEIAKKYLPLEDIYRTKMGFGVPIGNWFRTSMKEEMETILSLNYPEIKMDVFKNLFLSHLKGNNETDKLVTLYSFHLWKNRIQLNDRNC